MGIKKQINDVNKFGLPGDTPPPGYAWFGGHFSRDEYAARDIANKAIEIHRCKPVAEWHTTYILAKVPKNYMKSRGAK